MNEKLRERVEQIGRLEQERVTVPHAREAPRRLKTGSSAGCSPAGR